MLSWILQTAVISIIFIFLVHHIFGYLKSTLTIPKIKDLVNSPTKKYQHIFDTISNNEIHNDTPNNQGSYTDINLLPTEDTNTEMKDELKSFLKKQLNSKVDSSNNHSDYTDYTDYTNL
jgi:hypothetical protein